MARWSDILKLRFQTLTRRKRAEQELARELRFHLEWQTAENIASGMSPVDARNAALRAMGGLAQVEEQCRDTRRVRTIENLWTDLRYSWRVLRRSPVFTFVAALSLALGIGANVAMFSVIETVLLRPLPYARPARLVAIEEAASGMPGSIVLPPEFAFWRNESHSFSGLAAWNDTDFNVTGGGEPERVIGALVNADFFRVLGVRPAIGHDFSIEEDQGQPSRAAVIGNALWQRRFGGDPHCLGKTIVLNDAAFTVSGVMPATFRFPGRLLPEIFVPGGYSAPANWGARSMSLMRTLARLRPLATVAGATDEIQTIQKRHLGEIPAGYRRFLEKRSTIVTPLQRHLEGDLRTPLLILLGAVFLVLLITCANMAGLQLARASARGSEMAIRAALGGGRGRLMSMVLIENLLLAAIGGALAVAAVYASIPALRHVRMLQLADPADLRVDLAVLLFALAVTLCSALFFGLAPALGASQGDLNRAMKSQTRTVSAAWSSRLRSALVAAEVAIALVLVLGAGLLFKSMAKLLSNDLGLEPSGVLSFSFRIPPQRLTTPQQVVNFAEEFVARTRSLAGVEGGALTTGLPLDGYSLSSSLVFEGRAVPPPGARPNAPIIAITPDYFHVLRIPVLAGRGFNGADRDGAPPVAIVNHSFACMYFPGADAMGKRLALGS